MDAAAMTRTSVPILTFASVGGGYVANAGIKRDTGKYTISSVVLDLTFAMSANRDTVANVKSTTLVPRG